MFDYGMFVDWWPLETADRVTSFRPAQCADSDVFIEALLPVPYRSVQSTMTAATGWGRLRALVETHAKTVCDVGPRTWQSDLKLSAKRGESKTDHKKRIAYMVRALLNLPSLPIYAADAVAIGVWALHVNGQRARPRT